MHGTFERSWSLGIVVIEHPHLYGSRLSCRYGATRAQDRLRWATRAVTRVVHCPTVWCDVWPRLAEAADAQKGSVPKVQHARLIERMRARLCHQVHVPTLEPVQICRLVGTDRNRLPRHTGIPERTRAARVYRRCIGRSSMPDMVIHTKGQDEWMKRARARVAYM